jgi:2-succinyl-5-enolpyruvyl-6-hydroxy-3-cyclohexene-1-carboxylate synthase
VNYSDIGINTFNCLNEHYKSDPAAFFKFLNQSPIQRNTINFEAKWRSKDLISKDRLLGFFDLDKSRTDIHVFHHLNENLQQNDVLHLANSSVVRYMQLFDPIKSIEYHANRGTSGIDGSMSTAVGSATASYEKNHVFVTGDISFIYDSNALWINPFPKNLKIIVIDNRGGGIFRIIDGPRTAPQLETYFEAEHKASPFQIAKAYGLKVSQISENENIKEGLYHFLNEGQEQILIVPTDQKENPLALQRFFKHLKDD